jgi:nicotinamide-nucleotide amidase
MDRELTDLSAQVGQALRENGLALVTAESCTGGWVAEVVTATAGSSEWFDRGLVTYSNAAKEELLGVAPETLRTHGAVSEPAVRQMATGALRASNADVALAITGIAGPSGGTAAKPVGTVFFAWCRRGAEPITMARTFSGDRESVRRQSVLFALRRLIALLGRSS